MTHRFDRLYGSRFFQSGIITKAGHLVDRNGRFYICTCTRFIRLGTNIIPPGRRVKKFTRSKYNIRM